MGSGCAGARVAELFAGQIHNQIKRRGIHDRTALLENARQFQVDLRQQVARVHQRGAQVRHQRAHHGRHQRRPHVMTHGIADKRLIGVVQAAPTSKKSPLTAPDGQ